jgi:hypothetical protein
VPASLPVDLNDSALHEIGVSPVFSTTGSFSLDLDNHGEAVHVHLHLDDDLSRVARIDANNHYVDAGVVRPVAVEVAEVSAPVTGRLKLVTGYGAETEYVEVTVEPLEEEQEPVTVDESLSRPNRSEPEPTPLERLRRRVDGAAVPVVALGGVAIVLALGVGVLAESLAVLAAAAVVVVGVLAALAFLFR